MLPTVDGLAQTLGISVELFTDLLWTVIILALFFLVRTLTSGVAKRRIKDQRARYAIRKAINTAATLLAIASLVVVWTQGGPGIATYIAILSAGVAVSLGEPLSNLAGWLYIVTRQPFRLGDRIEINELRGDIVDIGLNQFSMAEIGNWVDADHSTGRLLHIPNSWVFKHSSANYTLGFEFIWEELPITVTFESNWKRARDLLTEALNELTEMGDEQAASELDEAADRYAVRFSYLSPIVYTSVADIGVTLTLRYVCRPRRRRATAAKIWERVLEIFAEHDDIDFAYPTMRFYDNRTEGKPDARAD